MRQGSSARASTPLAILILTAMSLFFTSPHEVQAQGDTTELPSWRAHPELYVMLQDSSLVYRISLDGGDTIPANLITPSYDFEILYDSISITSYLLTEWKRNGNTLRLPKWHEGRRVHAQADMLSFNSQTDTFTCSTGDTLSFYRELSWRNPLTSRQDTNNYYSHDTLTYSVELVRLSDSTRIALLDSMGVLPSTEPERPRIHAMRPLMALATYTIPASLNGVRAFMRLRVRHKGNGAYYFTRFDDYTLGVSQRLIDSTWQAYLNLFSIGQFAYKVRELETVQDDREDNQGELSVRYVPGSNSEIVITFDAARTGGTAVAIYDALGNQLFYPYMTPAAKGKISVSYRFDRSGTYFVGLLHNNRLTRTRIIHITL